MGPGSNPSLGLGDPRDGSKAHPPQDAVHDKGPDAAVILLGGNDFPPAVAADHAARDFTKRETDDEGSEAVHSSWVAERTSQCPGGEPSGPGAVLSLIHI